MLLRPNTTRMLRSRTPHSQGALKGSNKGLSALPSMLPKYTRSQQRHKRTCIEATSTLSTSEPKQQQQEQQQISQLPSQTSPASRRQPSMFSSTDDHSNNDHSSNRPSSADGSSRFSATTIVATTQTTNILLFRQCIDRLASSAAVTTGGIVTSPTAAATSAVVQTPVLAPSAPQECLSTYRVADPAVHGKLMQFVQHILQRSADGSGPVIDGVMLLGGPPCTMYSVCQTYSLPSIIEPDPDAFRRKLYASDRVVTAFLNLYGTLKAQCADAKHRHPLTQKVVPSCILMENPYSPPEMYIKYTPAEVAASDGKLQPRQVKLVEQLNLSSRHFLQPYLASTGGPLHITLHNWCSYAHLTHPMKPTYIFTDLATVQDTPCICKECRAPGNFSLLGAKVRNVQLYKQHFVKVAELGNGDGGERATWPDSWLSRMAWLFSSEILLQSRGRNMRAP